MCLVLRRMPANLDPVCPDQHGNIIVQIQGINCRPSTGRAADDLGPISTPTEMTLPLLSPRVEKPRPATRLWIVTAGFIALMTIAQRTGQPQVLYIIAAAPGTWFDMLDLERFIDMLLVRSTVATAVLGLFDNTGSYRETDLHHSARSASQTPRRTASTMASDFSTRAVSFRRRS